MTWLRAKTMSALVNCAVSGVRGAAVKAAVLVAVEAIAAAAREAVAMG